MGHSRMKFCIGISLLLFAVITPARAKLGLHLAAGVYTGSSPAANQMKDEYAAAGWEGISYGFGGGVVYPVSRRYGKIITTRFEKDISPYFRVGAHMTSLHGAEVKGVNLEREAVHGTAYGVLLEARRRPRSYGGNIELAAAVGVDWDQVEVEGHLGYHQGTSYRDQPYKVDGSGLGRQVRGTLDYYVARNISVQLSAHYFRVQDTHIPEQSIGEGVNEKRLPAHTINISTLALGIALRFHS